MFSLIDLDPDALLKEDRKWHAMEQKKIQKYYDNQMDQSKPAQSNLKTSSVESEKPAQSNLKITTDTTASPGPFERLATQAPDGKHVGLPSD